MITASLQFEKCYLETIRIVSSHDLKDDLIFSYGAYFKQLAKNLNGKLINNQVSQGSPPEAPLVIIQSKGLNISFSKSQVQIEIQGERKHSRPESLYAPVKSKISQAKGILESYYSRDEFKTGFVGIVGPVRFPQQMSLKKEMIMQELSKMFCDKMDSDELVNFSIRQGFLDKKKSLYVNYETQDYEVKNIKIDPKEQPTGVINLDTFPTVEKGVLLNIDVNNRPRMNKKLINEEVDDVIDSFFYFIENNKFLKSILFKS